MSLPIETPRLALRRLTLEDGEDLLALAADPSFARAVPELEPGAPGVRHYIERQLAFQSFEQERVFDLGIERREDRRVIGLLTLVRKGESGAIGWALGARYRRQGYASEAATALLDYAFASLGIERVEAETANGNEASWRLMERLGMRREASLRGSTVEGSRPVDSFQYVIRREEWRAAGREKGGRAMAIGRFYAGVSALLWCPDTRKYLLLRRSAVKDYGGGAWECVTGRVDQGEGFAEAARREVQEELGIEAQVDFVLGTMHFYRGDSTPENELVGVYFACSVREPEPIRLSWEHAEARWVTASEAYDLLPADHWLAEAIRRAERVRALASAELLEQYRAWFRPVLPDSPT